MADTRLTINELFDPNYYRQANPDLAGLSDRQALDHFLTYGLSLFEATFIAGEPPGIGVGGDENDNDQDDDNDGIPNDQDPDDDGDGIPDDQDDDDDDDDGGDTGGIGGGTDGFLTVPAREFSALFDADYYATQNPDLVRATPRETLQSFLDIGLPQGRQFSPYIDLNYYRANNPDIAGLDNNQLFRHLRDFGIGEGRRFSALYDPSFYRANNPDLAGLDNRQLFFHFRNFGLAEGRVTIPLFDVNFYRTINNLPATLTNQALIEDFLAEGLDDGLRFTPFFDVEYYRNNNPDLRIAGLNNRQLFEHFQRVGIDEGRRFSQFFDARYYLNNNPDLRAAGFNFRQAFNHFITNGVNEGRRPSQLFDPQYYVANNPDLLAQQFSFKRAFEHFQISGFNEDRQASVSYQPYEIAPFFTPVPDGTPPNPRNPSEWIEDASRWDDIPARGTLTYSFVTTASAPLYEGAETGVREVSLPIKNNVRNIMQTYGQYLGINFVEVPDRPPNVGRIRIMFSDGPVTNPIDDQTYAYAYLPTDFPNTGLAGDVHLNPNRGVVNYEEGPGSFAYQVLLHEIGHALGLDHPFDDAPTFQDEPTLASGKDNNSNTVMSYNFFPFPPGEYNGSFALTPMSYDIRALQYLYGASYLNEGDTVYRFDVNNFIGLNEINGRNGVKQTLWDSGGIDTFDFSALPAIPAGYYFDINEGGVNTTQIALNGSTYSILRGVGQNAPPPLVLTTNSFGTNVGFGALIENLVGSQGDDEIVGNNLANNIAAGPGNDIITGGGGQDILSGGDGSNIFVVAVGEGGPTNQATADIIVDFKPGIDKIGLSFGVPLGAIAITQGTGANASNTLISVPSTGQLLAVLGNIPAAIVSYNDFTYV